MTGKCSRCDADGVEVGEFRGTLQFPDGWEGAPQDVGFKLCDYCQGRKWPEDGSVPVVVTVAHVRRRSR